MKTKVGHYYVFIDAKDFWEKVMYWHVKGWRWVYENHDLYQPTVKQEDMPCVLSIDDKTMGWGKVSSHKDKYFIDDTFVQLYTLELRKKKLKRIIK